MYKENNNKRNGLFFKMVNWFLNIFFKFIEVFEIDKNKINSDS